MATLQKKAHDIILRGNIGLVELFQLNAVGNANHLVLL